MQALTNARGYDWATWLLGIVRSAVSGGALSILNTGGTAIIVPESVNTGAGLHKLLALLGIYFVIGAVIHMAIFLSTHGAPDPFQQSLATAAVQADKTVVQAQKSADAVADAQSKAPVKE
jgi:predicted transporter